MSLEGPSHEPYLVNPYTLVVGETERRHRLFSAHWELTYRCNEHCTHCYLDVFKPNEHVPGELTTEECLRTIDQLADLGTLHLTMSGGEIFVRRDFFEIAEYARSKGFLLRLFTNGLLIKPEVADRIAALHPYVVEISVYGTDAATHDKITQVSRSFELSTGALRLLHERGIRTVMKTPFMRENVYQIHELRALADQLGAQYRYDITITAKDNGGRSPLEHRMTYEQLIWLFRQEMRSEEWVSRTLKPNQPTCGISLNSLLVDPYGNIFPCVQTRTLVGNIKQQSLRAIWEESPVWAELGRLTIGELPVCRTCELQSMCVRCHGIAKLEDGDIRNPASVNCREALARRQVLIEKGALPTDYPIPAHLQEYAEHVLANAVANS
jgi:radical SAM protein with 4Fe4S-binding SPASM domain